ncbi:MAG TPA: methionine--tRNA ligase [Acidimicrobiia bacterium]|nr:methionine--tRNA ligase [Acidimicrobiia bacterium]
MDRYILVAVAWPYASGSLHLGHLAGAYLPADIFARYHRRAGNRVLMVSGSDAHGTPITVKADQEGISPAEVVGRYHPEILGYWETVGISFDLFTTTMTDNHRQVTWDIFRRHRKRGTIVEGTSLQFYDPEKERFLPDRYVEGTCPYCGYPSARGDQCDNCGRTLDATDLLNPRSRLSGATPVQRETRHWFLRLGAFADEVKAWLGDQTTWRRHVKNWALGMIEEGLPDRAITRDLEWGIPLPPEADILGPGKRIYVWFEAVIGYLSAAKEWAQRQGTPEAWRQWWQNPEAESYYFVGKDNIPFHAVIWPAMLMGYGEHNLPTDVPANQFVTFKGAKASKSMGVGRSIGWYAERLEPDALRYAVAAVLPEQNDTDLSDDDIVRRVNDELVATWGNLVNRVLTLTARHFEGQVPPPGDLLAEDQAVIDRAAEALRLTGELIEQVELRAGLRTAMEGAASVNVYLNATEPWKLVKADRARAGTVLWSALQAMVALGVAFSPYLPFTTIKLEDMLGGSLGNGWQTRRLEAGTPLGEISPLFSKIEDDIFEELS